MTDPAKANYCRADFAYAGVYNRFFSDILKRAEQFGSHSVTRRRLKLGDPDSTTGWYAKEWDEYTLDMVIQKAGAVDQSLGVGKYVKYTVTGFCLEPVAEDDEIYCDYDNRWYEVKTVEEVRQGDDFYFRVCELVELPLHV